MASDVIQGREGKLYLSTSSGSTAFGSEIANIDAWSLSMNRDIIEITNISQNSKKYVEGLVGGSLTASGQIIAQESNRQKLYNRFMKLSMNDTSDTSQDDIVDGNLFFHLIARPIDTAATGDEIDGIKFVAPALSGGLSVDVSGADVESFSYDGTVNGDVLYVESTSTARGIPKA